jgi:ornithine cyclodeaminase
VQARFHVQTIRRVRAIDHVLVCATSEEKGRTFCEWVASETGLSARVASPEEASAADVLATCTTSPTPVVVASAVREGAHINAVGAFAPSTRELPSELVARARVYVDTRAGAFSEAGDLLLARNAGFTLDRVVGEVGEVLLGRVSARQNPDEVTLYKSVGAAFLDAASARLAFEEAGHQAVGAVYEFDAE